jgi:hypothetical protein
MRCWIDDDENQATNLWLLAIYVTQETCEYSTAQCSNSDERIDVAYISNLHK